MGILHSFEKKRNESPGGSFPRPGECDVGIPGQCIPGRDILGGLTTRRSPRPRKVARARPPKTLRTPCNRDFRSGTATQHESVFRLSQSATSAFALETNRKPIRDGPTTYRRGTSRKFPLALPRRAPPQCLVIDPFTRGRSFF